MKILQVSSVTVFKQSTSPFTLLIQAHGFAATTGWKNPRLDSSGDPNPADAVLEFTFEADKPGGITLQVLTPISATAVVTSKTPIDAVVVAARTNSITVLAADFISDVAANPPNVTEAAVRYTTLMLGEEKPVRTTWRIGEEGGTPTTWHFGEEHGPWTTPLIDDPTPPWGKLTTQALGEEGGGHLGDIGPVGPGPFGGY